MPVSYLISAIVPWLRCWPECKCFLVLQHLFWAKDKKHQWLNRWFYCLDFDSLKLSDWIFRVIKRQKLPFQHSFYVRSSVLNNLQALYGMHLSIHGICTESNAEYSSAVTYENSKAATTDVLTYLGTAAALSIFIALWNCAGQAHVNWMRIWLWRDEYLPFRTYHRLAIQSH